MPKVLPRHRNNATGQLGWDEFYNVLNTKQQSEFWVPISGSSTIDTINAVSAEGYGDQAITFTGDNVTVELDIRIPMDTTLGASGFLRVRSNSAVVNAFYAGVRCYNSDKAFLGNRNFIASSELINTSHVTFNELIFDVGGLDNQFPANTSFVKPFMSWSTQSTFVELFSYLVRPLDNARKALYV